MSNTQDDIPEDPCVICLDVINNVSTTNVCSHRFCFECIKQWSKMNPTCPLCKRQCAELFYDFKEDKSHSILKVESNVADQNENADDARAYDFMESILIHLLTNSNGTIRAADYDEDTSDSEISDDEYDVYELPIHDFITALSISGIER